MAVNPGHLREALRAALKAGTLNQSDILKVLHEEGDKYPDYRDKIETDDDLEIDEGFELYSHGEDGVWVSAWVFVPHPVKDE